MTLDEKVNDIALFEQIKFLCTIKLAGKNGVPSSDIKECKHADELVKKDLLNRTTNERGEYHIYSISPEGEKLLKNYLNILKNYNQY